MEQRISMITLGVADLQRSRTFYEAMGWQGQEVEGTVFFQAGGMVLVLWHQDELAEDAAAGPLSINGFRGVALAHNVRDRASVDAIVGQAQAAGATVSSPPAETFYGGYAGYFTDPDGHAWEIAHNPGFSLADDGTLIVPDLG